MDDEKIINCFGGKFIIEEHSCMYHTLLYNIIKDSSKEKLNLDNCYVYLQGKNSNDVELSIVFFKKAKYKGKDHLYDLEWFESQVETPDWTQCRLKYEIIIEISSGKSEKFCQPYGRNFRSKTILRIDHEFCISEEDDMWSDTCCFILDDKKEIEKYFSFESEMPNYVVDFLDVLREFTDPEYIYSYCMEDEDDVNVVKCHIFNNFIL